MSSINRAIFNAVVAIGSTLVVLLAYIPGAYAGFAGPIFAINSEFSPVTPCRIIDTREGSDPSPIAANAVRSFRVHGDVADQGGNPDGCFLPREGNVVGVHMNVGAVPVGPAPRGNLRVFPALDAIEPQSSLVNFTLGTNTSNSGTVATSAAYDVRRTPESDDISIRSNFSGSHVFVDVLGYYYGKTDDEIALKPIAIGSYDTDGNLVRGSSLMEDIIVAPSSLLAVVRLGGENITPSTHTVHVTLTAADASQLCLTATPSVLFHSDLSDNFIVQFVDQSDRALRCPFDVVVYRYRGGPI